MAIEVLGSILLGTSLYGSGIILALIGLIIGITRSQTNEQTLWPLVFGVYCITISFLFKEAILGGSLLVLGLITLLIAYLQVHENVTKMNIMHLAIIFAVINITGLLLSTAWAESNTWELSAQETKIGELLGGSKTKIDQEVPTSGICAPGTTCTGQMLKGGDVDYTAYDVYTSILNVVTYTLKVAQFIVMLPFTPWILTSSFQEYILNPVLAQIFGIILTFINIIIIYQAYNFIADGRGLK